MSQIIELDDLEVMALALAMTTSAPETVMNCRQLKHYKAAHGKVLEAVLETAPAHAWNEGK